MKKVNGILIAAVVLLLLLFNSVKVVTYNNEYTLIKQFGQITRVQSEPGLSFKVPLIQSVQKLPNHEMCYDIPISTITTADKKIMKVDSFVLWEITDPVKYVSSLGGTQSNAETKLNNIVYSAMKAVFSSNNQSSIISGRDGKLANDITAKIGNQLDQYGIRVSKVETKMLDLPDENREAVYKRMISERNSIAAEYNSRGLANYQKIINDTDKTTRIMLAEANKQANQLAGEAEAEYMRILSSAYNNPGKADFYNFQLSLEALKNSLKGENKTIILDENSDLARALMGVG